MLAIKLSYDYPNKISIKLATPLIQHKGFHNNPTKTVRDFTLKGASVPAVLHDIKTANQTEADQETDHTTHQTNGAVLLVLEVRRKHQHDDQ